MINKLGKMFANKVDKKEKTKRTVAAAPKANLLTSVLNDLPVKEAWLDEREMSRIFRDGSVISSSGIRKSAVLRKSLYINSQDEDMANSLKDIFKQKLIRKFLDTPYQGFSVFELNWFEKDGYFYPSKVIERNYRSFNIKDDELYFSSNGVERVVEPYKAIWATYEEKFNNPLGKPLANALFWYVKFKNSSLEFWIRFQEKFGLPWAIGKTIDGDKDLLAEEIYSMLSGDNAVIDSEDSIELISAKGTGDFNKLIEYCDNQIREIILGGNLTGEVKGGSHAAAKVHQEVKDDIAMADENVVVELINDVINAFVDLNAITTEITVELKDKDDPNIELANRDEKISKMGYRPTKEYLEETYNIKLEDTPKIVASKNSLNNTFAFKGSNFTVDELETKSRAKVTKDEENSIYAIIEPIMSHSGSFEEAVDKLLEVYPNFDTSLIEKTLAGDMMLSELLARAEIEDEDDRA